MRWSDIPFDPPRRTLRQFAWLWLAFFGGMALWQALVKAHIALGLTLAALALIVGSLGLTRPETGSFHLRWLDDLGLPNRLDSLAGHAGADVLRAVHAVRPRVSPHWPRSASAHSAIRPRIVLGTQANTNRPEALFQAVLSNDAARFKS